MLSSATDLGSRLFEWAMEILVPFKIEEYVDVHLMKWLIWLFTPIVVSFLLPVLIFLLFYVSALIIHLYRLRRLWNSSWDFYEIGRRTVALLWDAHGWIWNGYEVVGLENIPNKDEGGALLIFYHGAIPLDYYYLLAKCILYKDRMVTAVADRFLFKVPGWKVLMEAFRVFPGSVTTCVQVLRDGDLVAISPGGLLEAQFGDENYQLMWGKRVGFAKVAIEAKVPIIPFYTQNIREAFRTVSTGKSFFRKLYDKVKFPVLPIYGNFPVKLRTIIGKPIPYDPNATPEEVALKAAQAVEALIMENQHLPGSIVKALLQRVVALPKTQPKKID